MKAIAFAALVAAAAATNSTLRGISPPLCYQCDDTWAGQKLGTCGDTICSAGCAMSSVAMYLSYRGWGGNPSSLDEWLTNNGGYVDGCLIVWGSVDAFGFSSFQGIQYPTYEETCNGVDAGHGIVISVNNGGHYVLINSCNGDGTYNVNDPAWGYITYSHDEAGDFIVYH